MKFTADLHVHSHFSRATSKNLNLEHLAKWAQIKGIQLVGTGDFVHPGWLEELRQKLEPAEDGLFRLKNEFAKTAENEVPKACRGEVRFMLSVEISNIYKRLDRVRKVHNLIYAPHFEAAEKLQARLESIGNIRSDGRPILGLDSRDLLEITLETDPYAYLIPAHIWTPWFSAMGSKGGFDRMADCFGDLIGHIFAVETGLSSDPLMNWRLSQLDPYILVSNSDAHSPQKLAREANVFDTELSFYGVFNALADPEDNGLLATIEFFPEEGKYHYDGHRNCKLRWHPNETIENDGVCPVCGKKVTVGVMARVEELADRPENSDAKPPRWRPFFSLIPLPEIIAEARGVGAATKTVQSIYFQMLTKLGNEIFILRDAPIEDIQRCTDALIAEGVRRTRNGEVKIDAGYDGEFGTIKLFSPQERSTNKKQVSLLPKDLSKYKQNGQNSTQRDGKNKNEQDPLNAKIDEGAKMRFYPGALQADSPPDFDVTPSFVSDEKPFETASSPAVSDLHFGKKLPEDLNSAQWKAVTHSGSHLLIVAGPGTGKTHTLTYRIAHIAQCFCPPGEMLALTFTNKAADEMKQRLRIRLKAEADALFVGTFHALCLQLLRDHSREASVPENFGLAAPDDIDGIAKSLWPDKTNRQRKNALNHISRWKAGTAGEQKPAEIEQFQQKLRDRGLLDFDDLLCEAVNLLERNELLRRKLQAHYKYVFVDEYQDINAIQHKLLKLLVGENGRLTAIGDPNQAIYGFRGADVRFFAMFADEFEDSVVLHLSNNYRSAQNLLNACGQVIYKNRFPGLPLLTAKIASKGRLTIHETPTEKSEAEYVVHQIEKMVGGTSMFSQDSGRVASEAESECSFGDIAVLYRLNVQRRALEEAFERSGIPFQISGDAPLLQQPGVAEMMTFLKLAAGASVGKASALALLQKLIAGLGETAAKSIAAFFESHNQLSMQNLAALLDDDSPVQTRLHNNLKAFFAGVEEIKQRVTENGIKNALQHLALTAGWQKRLVENEPVNKSWQQLIRISNLHDSMQEFLDAICLRRDVDQFDSRAERVSLMTMHAAKGLEFPVVFIVGCEDELIPLKLDGFDAETAEERRVFYVGMTRAKDQLTLVRAKSRTLFGKKIKTKPSPFIGDISEQLKAYDKQNRRPPRNSKQRSKAQLDFFH